MGEAISAETFCRVVFRLRDRGFGGDVDWSENCGPPADAEDFASEAIFVICNSGMKNTVARRIYDRVMDALGAGRGASSVFGHAGKSAAIDDIWSRREHWLFQYSRVTTDADRLSACEAMPWIGPITKYHLAKNFGAQVAKPDVHLQRLADLEGVTPQVLCERLSAEVGLKIATVDLVLWRACAEGIINSRTGRADLKWAHQSRANGASERMRQEDAELRREFIANCEKAAMLAAAPPPPSGAPSREEPLPLPSDTREPEEA
jgi:hypothetical protein